jgi:hypothetical protein
MAELAHQDAALTLEPTGTTAYFPTSLYNRLNSYYQR